MNSVEMLPDQIAPRSIGPRRLSLAVLALALGLLGGAFVFQYWVGLVPCELCLEERLPWYAAIPIAVIGALWQPRRIGLAFALLFLASSALAFYHVGVEQHVFAGPTACTGAKIGGGSIEDLTRQLEMTPPVQCDQIQWSLAGISLAGWNLLASLLVVALAGWSLRRTA